MEAFAQDEFGQGQVERGVKLGAGGALDAMVGPERLGAIAQLDFFERALSGVGAGEGGMRGGVPVLGEDDVPEFGSDAVNDGDHRVAVGYGQRATGAEVVLHVDDNEDVLGGDLHIGLRLVLSTFVAYDGPNGYTGTAF